LTPKKLKITPFRDNIEKSRKEKHGKEKPENISKKKIRIDSEFLRKLMQHEEKENK